MIDSKTNARITGVLFILGTVPAVAVTALWGQLISSEDYLSLMAANSVCILLTALVVMFMGFVCAGIGVALYPVLKPHGEGLALGVMGFRFMEGTLQVVNAIILVVLLAISQEFVKAGSPPDSFFQSAGALVRTVRDWGLNGTAAFAWCIGAFIYYTVFYRKRLVPRWLSVWGLVGLAMFLVSTFAAIFGFLGSMSAVRLLLCLPIMVQEMVLAVRLITKGYTE